MFDPSHLRSFVALAHELNFNRAARVLNMTQPPLTRHIQALERQLSGVLLFDRTSRSVQLTASGRVFLAEAAQLIRLSEEALRLTRRAAETPTGAVSIGFIGASTYSFLPRTVLRAREACPSIRLEFHEMEAAQQIEALLRGKIDLGLMRPQPGEKRLHARCVMREPFALAVPISHPLAARRRPRIEQIDGEPFIMYGADAPYLNALLTGFFERTAIRPIVVQTMSHSQAVLSLVSIGLGLAIVPQETRNACFDNVVFRPISLDGAEVELQALWSSQHASKARDDLMTAVLPAV